ncbi:hypothetical protein [Pseudomonas sp. LP_4_YM]|uniref:hypothetical protein n=1 Tax=Pseudomonas sp. LP_4_YM TaxID=2485135 RepID=UPI00104EDD04|nr:hypothetical protein [Pseudomonas sp. LP_4_YM]TCT96109.1 hypothetical protein EC913_108113 [Pseudomonas sp. LP_4_YM]
MENRRFSIKPDTPELKALCDAIGRAQGNPIMEVALSQYVSRLVVSTMADPRFRASLSESASEAKAKAKQERIDQIRDELARLEAE